MVVAAVDLPFNIHVKTPGLCIYYDGHHCRYKSKNGIKTKTDGPCPKELRGTVPTCKGQPDPFAPQPAPKANLRVDPPKDLPVQVEVRYEITSPRGCVIVVLFLGGCWLIR